MFIVVFLVMLPTYLKTSDAILAWQAGLAWAFIIGIIILAGAFVGPTIRRYTPRAAMLGALAGTLGALQATEVVKEILGIGRSLSGRLLMYDALGASFDEVAIAKRPDCPTCGAA